MGLASRGRQGRSENRQPPESGQSHLARPPSHLRQRCLGARLLPQIQQPPSRVPASLVERSELGRNQQALRSFNQEVVVASCYPVATCHLERTQGLHRVRSLHSRKTP